MSAYRDFKKNNQVTALSREELFEAAYRLGQATDSAKLIEAHKALRDIAEVMMPAFRAGAVSYDQIGKVLSKVKAYDYRLITCSYCFRYVR